MSKSSSESFDLAAFLQQNGRTVAIGAVVVAAAGGGLWFWRSSAELKETRAAQALGQGEQALFSGNLPLAETELQKVVQRYDGTAAGVRAQMLLAQALYGQGRHDQGVETLRRVVGTGAAKPFRAPIHALIASGLEDLAKFDDAAAAYGEAAKTAVTSLERDAYKGDQARVLQSSGKKDAALVIWKELAADDNSPMAGEAKMRIGELETATASRG
jgi:predicted negative regulator of RcsB-dependent stress response